MFDSHTENLRDVFQTLSSAAADGDHRAVYAVATWHLHGKEGFLDANPAKALPMLHSIEDSYVAEALFDLAIFYDFGEYVEEDEQKAFALYLRAGLLGDAESCGQISQYFREGKVVPDDQSIAEAWNIRSQQLEVDISPPYRIWLRPSPQLADESASKSMTWK